MLHDEIANLFSGHGAATFGGDFFVGSVPDVPADAVGFYEYGGETPLHTKDRRLPINELPRFQLLTRSVGYVAGRNRAETLHRILLGFRGGLVGVEYARIAAMQSSPFLLDRDDKGRYRFVCNYQARKELSPLPG